MLNKTRAKASVAEKTKAFRAQLDAQVSPGSPADHSFHAAHAVITQARLVDASS